MLGRLSCFDNAPIAPQAVQLPESRQIDIVKELKLGVVCVCELNKKLSHLSWQAREIIHGWLQNGKQF